MATKCSTCKEIFLTFEEYQKHKQCSLKYNRIKSIPKTLDYITL